MEHDDDRMIGRILSRREALALFGAAGVILLPGCGSNGSEPTSTSTSTPTGPGQAGSSSTTSGAPQVETPSCIASPAIDEGPFFVDEKLNRSDVRTDPSDGSMTRGVPLEITFRLARMSGASCTALAGAMVDIWSANAAGKYSDVAREGTVGKKFLRGFQTTDDNGLATFTTVYPGWYSGRTAHLHVKIRPTSGRALTTQLFFDDSLSDNVFAQSPYDARGRRGTRNSNDRIYGQNGSKMIVSLNPDGEGYTGMFSIGVQA